MWIGLLLGIGLAGWGVFSTRIALYPERRNIPAPQPTPSYTTHALTANDGATFDVWLLETASPKGLLAICHGYYANRHQVLDLAHRLRERRYEVVLIELRGHGSRPGPCTLGIKETGDALAALQWAEARSPQRRLPIGLLGFSTGAAVLCQLAHEAPMVRAVVTDSVFSHLFPIVRRGIWRRYHLPSVPFAWITWWGLRWALGGRLAPRDPAAIAAHLHQPLLAIQGGADAQITPQGGDQFYAAWAGPKERWFEPTAIHVGLFASDPVRYVQRVADFFDRTLPHHR